MEDRCVMCGEIIPEGRQVCKECTDKIKDKETKNMKNKTKKVIVTILVALTVSLVVIGCTEAEKVSVNVSQEADNFNVIRRLTVLNARSDKPMFELIGAFSISVDAGDNQLEVTCETGKNQYKKHFIGLNEWTMYVVEDIGGANVDKYRYEVNFQPEAIVPITFTNKD